MPPKCTICGSPNVVTGHNDVTFIMIGIGRIGLFEGGYETSDWRCRDHSRLACVRRVVDFRTQMTATNRSIFRQIARMSREYPLDGLKIPDSVTLNTDPDLHWNLFSSNG